MFSFFNKKPKHTVPDYIIYSVDNFNNWFNAPKKSYANPGIFLRTDKLSTHFIAEYLKDCYNLELHEQEMLLISNFYESIKKDWINKLIHRTI